MEKIWLDIVLKDIFIKVISKKEFFYKEKLLTILWNKYKNSHDDIW